MCELPTPIHLEGSYECALVDISGGLPTSYCVFCDIIETNIIKGVHKPVLRKVYRSKEFQNLQFIKVKDAVIHRIRIYIKDSDLQEIVEKDKVTHCTLCLRKSG